MLRKKPPGQLLASAHQVDREYRVMKALGTVDFPVPQHARAVPRRERHRHHLLRDGLPGRPHLPRRAAAGPGAGRAGGDLRRAERGARALHQVDYEAIGLADYGRPGNYFVRQIDRWTKQYRGAETMHIPAMERLIAWLEQNEPPKTAAPRWCTATTASTT